jgi:dTDP-4-amino-4,6-dideoxygalactose transaminase
MSTRRFAVPMADLAVQHSNLEAEIRERVDAVVARSAFINGAEVAEFERAFSEWQGVEHVVGCANGTEAIYIVLKTLGVGPGDEVLVPAHTWISTAEAVTQTGAQPVFIDVDQYYHLDPERAAAAVTPSTRAVIGVHLFGQPFDVAAIEELCAGNGLVLVEDCAQAHGARWDGHPVGSFGAAGTFSFFPGKNVGAWGDAGAIVSTDPAIAQRCRRYAQHGSPRRHQHEVPGINSRLDTVQAAVLLAKLTHARTWNARRAAVAAKYTDAFADLDWVQTPLVRPGVVHVWHQYVVQVEDRPAVLKHLHDCGVETSVHYPKALPFTQAYDGAPGDFSVSEGNQERILSLPVYPEISDDQVALVVEAIRGFTG